MPTIISKYRISSTPWGTNSPANRLGEIIHHTVTAEGGSLAGVEAQIRGINKMHPYGAYNYAVDYLGNIWEIVGLYGIGAHASGANTAYWGIAYIGDGRYNFTPAAEAAIKELVAWLAGQSTVTDAIKGHCDVNSTACPGTIIIQRLRAGAFGTGYTGPATGGGSGTSTATIQKYQQRLIDLGYDLGPWGADGQHGPKTDAAVKAFQTKNGLEDDGVVGPLTTAKLFGKTTAPKPPATLFVDGEWGRLTTEALQRALGVKDDGQIGPKTISALQDRVGVKIDGELGPITRKGLQRHLKVAQDGVWGENTTKALQRRLNAGTF